MPNRVYMLSVDNLAARERLWQAFGADPEWQKAFKESEKDGKLVWKFHTVAKEGEPGEDGRGLDVKDEEHRAAKDRHEERDGWHLP